MGGWGVVAVALTSGIIETCATLLLTILLPFV